MNDLSYLHDILILLFAMVAIVVVFKQLRLSPALGYLVAGAAIGPFGFGVLTSTETTKSIAELGVVFLLFAIGLELTFDKLKSMRKYIFGFGSLQVIVTSVLISAICYFFGHLSAKISIIIGSALSMSSTAIVLEVIKENSEQSTRVGRLAFSTLLMQDLAVIPILVLLPLLSKTDMHVFHALGGAIGDAILAMLIIFAVGRLLLRPLYRLIVELHSDVLFLGFTLIIILGAAFLSHEMGLSFALGAFIAGLMVAETEYKYRVEEEILSLKSLLLSLFFMTIGMSFDFSLLLKSLPFIILATITLVSAKIIIVLLLCRLFRFPLAPSIHTGLLLAQGGEFAFVVFLMAVQQRLMEIDLAQFLMTVVTFSMALTPLLAMFGRRIKSYLYISEVLHDNKLKREIGDIEKHVVVVGFSMVGRIATYIMRKNGVRHIVLENNHRIVQVERKKGHNIYYGDAMNVDILRYIGVERCESVVVVMEDEIACMKISRFIRENFPHVTIITKTDTVNNIDRFKRVGANHVISKNLETGLQLINTALTSAGVSSIEISAAINSFRAINPEIIKEIIAIDDESLVKK